MTSKRYTSIHIQKHFIYEVLSNCFIHRHEIIKHLNSFLQIVQIICDLDRKCAEHQYGSLSPWWQRLRETLLEESSVFKSLLAAILCRDLSVLYRQNEVMKELHSVYILQLSTNV